MSADSPPGGLRRIMPGQATARENMLEHFFFPVYNACDIGRTGDGDLSHIDQLLKLLNCGAEKDWCDTVFSLARSYGFDQALFAVVPNKKAPLENAFLRSNYSSRWRDTYDSEKLHYVDPTVEHCLGSTIPLIWAPEIFGTPEQKKLYEEACGYGIRSGVTFPIHGANGEFGVFSFVSDVSSGVKFHRLLQHLMPGLSLIRDYAFESSLRFVKHPKEQETGIHLTKCETECLKWSMAGKSSWEISQILSCSEAVVNFHMNNLRRKFSVNTRQQVVIKAIRLGLITLD